MMMMSKVRVSLNKLCMKFKKKRLFFFISSISNNNNNNNNNYYYYYKTHNIRLFFCYYSLFSEYIFI